MSSFSEFLHMGGYGLYVWCSYGLAAAVLIWNAIIALRREKFLLQELAAKQKHESAKTQ